MSIYRDPRSPYWQYDFRWRDIRFFGSTKSTVRRKAEATQRQEAPRLLGAECHHLGGWYARLASRVGATKLVGDVLSEQQVRALYTI
jgi:hypothetical protein